MFGFSEHKRHEEPGFSLNKTVFGTLTAIYKLTIKSFKAVLQTLHAEHKTSFLLNSLKQFKQAGEKNIPVCNQSYSLLMVHPVS